jgi:hypothetical protein
MKRRVIIALLIAIAIGFFVHPSLTCTSSMTGRIVYSATMIFPDKTQVSKGDPVANVPIRIRLGVRQWTDTFGDGGPRTKMKRAWTYYTFTDQQGAFSIPTLWGIYLSTRIPGSRTEVIEPQFAILETTGNVTVEGGPERISPFHIIHPSDPLQKSLAGLRNEDASPIHKQDRDRLEAIMTQAKK